MVQKTYRLNSIDEISAVAGKIHDLDIYGSAKSKVLLSWASLWGDDEFVSFKREIAHYFPDFTTIGSNFHSIKDLLDAKIDDVSEDTVCLLTFLFFEDCAATLHDILYSPENEDSQGQELLNIINETTDVRGVYLVPPSYYCPVENILTRLKNLKNVPIFGVKTSLHPGYSVFGYNSNEEVLEKRLFILIFHGKSLSIRVRYNLGWTPVGKVMTVTKEENPFFVDEIDSKDASYVYNRYLGLRNDQIIPQNLSEFPLIIDRDGVKISRIGVTGQKDGQLVFGAPVYLNDRISLSYGNPDDLFAEIGQDTDDIREFEPEAGLLIVCANRVMLLRDREPEEIELYRKYISSVAHVYGYGEVFYLDGKGGELNSALVSVSFKEETNHTHSFVKDEKSPEEYTDKNTADIGQQNSLLVPFADRLSRMFKEMSGDLIQAVNEAEGANRAKSLFYSTVSHELRTPLNAIMGMNELIIKESSDKDVTEYAENIKSSGKLLLQLINDILDTEKLEAGKMEIVPVSYNVRSVMDEMARMIELSAKDKGLDFIYNPDENLPQILVGDEKRIRQCILNLLSNAVKYTHEGNVEFMIFARKRDESHAELTVSVKDSGIGIKPEDIDKLSIPFERVDNSKNYRVEGTGLGLNIVNNLLIRMDSKLEIKSVYGQGSEFSFTLLQEIPPTKSGESNAAGQKPSSATGRESIKAPNASILVVDDVLMNLKLIRLFLKDSLINIDTAQDASSALRLADSKKYDIIFLDRRMPDMDGVELFHRIKESDSGLNTNSVFIMLTAEGGNNVRENTLSEGFDDYMTKPFLPQVLEDIIRKYLQRQL